MRFIIVPDIHYLQDNHSSSNDEETVRGDGPPTQPKGYQERLEFLRDALIVEKRKGLDFFILNGDLVHDVPEAHLDVKTEMDKVGEAYHVGYGNHERSSEQHWTDVWGQDWNHDFTVGDYAFLMPNSSNQAGDRIPVDEVWLADKLAEYEDKKGILVVTHVPQTTRWRNSPDAVGVREILRSSDNLIGSVFSHVHGAITTERVDDLIFSMTGHFAHYGRNFYSYRIFEIDESNDTITSELYDVTHDRVVAKQTIKLVDGRWQWQDYSIPNNFISPTNFVEPIFSRPI